MEKDALTNSAPLVSICIAAYNVEKYILDSINSIICQTFNEIEIVIVDDGSTDGTGKILQSISDKRVKVLTSENRGQCAALNLAYSNSSGSFIKFMDADDIISSNFIELQLTKIRDIPDSIASAEWGRFYNDNLSTFRKNEEKVWQDMKPIDWLTESLKDGANMMQCALFLIPRHLLERSGLWNVNLTLINDFEFFIRVLLSASLINFTPGAILYYRSGISNSVSDQKTSKAYQSALMSVQLGTRTLLNFENSERVRLAAANAFQLWAYQFYSTEPELYKVAQDEVDRLGGSTLPFPSGGVTKFLSSIIGWKLGLKIKKLFK